jgi:uncharacterized membrane protein
MTKGRLEAFSDGVIAILITIMVLELKVPHGAEWSDLRPLLPIFLTYGLSFVFIGIYWNNHHHMLQATERINGKILWANHHLLFWLSLIPFGTGWMGENHLASVPTAVYGAVLLAAAIDRKGKLSALLYVAAIPLAFIATWLSAAIYVLVALIWLVPDSRIESRLQ